MALHSSDERHMGVSLSGAVMTEGGSLDLGKGVFGVFSTSNRKVSKRGLKALNTFDGIPKDLENLVLMFGDQNGSKSNKNLRSVAFNLNEVKKVGIVGPKIKEQTFDHWRVGWNGRNDSNTTLKFQKGETYEFQMTITGKTAAFFNQNSEYTIRTSVTVPGVDGLGPCEQIGNMCEPEDCREHTLTLVKNLNDYYLSRDSRLSQFFEIHPIFSKVNAVNSTVAYKKYTLDFCGSDSQKAFENVVAQYPKYKVVRDTFTGKIELIAPSGDTVAPFKQTKESLMKGCEDCPTGYTEMEGGYVYSVAIEDDGEDKKSDVEGISSNVVSGSAVKNGQDRGYGYYTVVLSKKLTVEEEKAFVEANKTSQIVSVGTIQDFCSNNSEVAVSWTETGELSTIQQKYRILLPDTCEDDRLEELKAAYPDLTITKVGSSENCITMYETTVIGEVSDFKGCSAEFIQQITSSKEPLPFDINRYWFPVIEEASKDATVKCGFEIKAKPIIFDPNEYLEDQLPFINTSMRIKALSGGYPMDYSILSMNKTNTWPVMRLDRARDLDFLGADLKKFEKMGQFYFTGNAPSYCVTEQIMTGTISKLKNSEQVADAYVTIEGSNKAGINSKEYTYITYHVLLPLGKTKEYEKLLASLASASGVPFERK